MNCEWGVRNKLWVDDLVKATNHTMSALQSELRDSIDESVFDDTKRELFRLGLLFCFKGKITFDTYKHTGKTYKKWSAVRPALRGHAILLMTKA